MGASSFCDGCFHWKKICLLSPDQRTCAGSYPTRPGPRMILSIVSANFAAGCASSSSTAAASGPRSLRISENDSRRRDGPLYNRDHMKVARIHQHGGPEALVYEDAPEPVIRANQALIRVRACALNHLDLFVRAGIPGLKFPMPHVLGSDIAGEVVEVGDLCERVKPGWRVLLSPGP